MPDPKQETLRSLEFDPQRPVNEDPNAQRNAAVSSKREKTEHGHVEKPPRSTRAARPSEGRAGNNSNSSRRTRGH